MKQYDSFTLTPSQFSILLIDAMIGIGVLSIANGASKYAKQDGWLSIFIGAAYPLYTILLAILMSNKFPEEGITTLTKKYFGKFLGTILNLVFCGTLLFYACSIASGLNNVLIVYVVQFLTPFKVVCVTVFIVTYTVSKNVEVLSKVNRIIFYSSFALFFIPIPALFKGSILNMKPFFQAGIMDHLKAAKDSMFSFAGIELIFIIYPFVKEKKKIKGYSLMAAGFTIILYVWFTFITFYYLGIDMIPKYLWSFIAVTDAVKVPVVTNFRFFFMLIWTLVMFRTISNNYYGAVFVVKDTLKKFQFKTVSYMLFPLLMYFSLKMGNEVNRRSIVESIITYLVAFNMVWITLLVVLIYLKRGCKNEKK